MLHHFENGARVNVEVVGEVFQVTDGRPDCATFEDPSTVDQRCQLAQCIHSVTARSHSPSFVRSATTNGALSSVANASSASLFRPVTQTFAPSRTRTRAVAMPMPEDAPVTSANWFVFVLNCRVFPMR
eukprot:m.112393 g.112393  ORF g.112393 m.112393 type:complete len:128 (+) comp15325_c2_seq3:709-1092(+)